MAGRRPRNSTPTPAPPGGGLGWLLLIHQLPPKPAYLRVKIWRRLQRLGAITLKNAVYVLPADEQRHEDFQWIRREIVGAGGEATICAARFVDGLTDSEVEAQFRAAREPDYAALAEEVRRAATQLSGAKPRDSARVDEIEEAIARFRRRLNEVNAIDFFGAPGRAESERLLHALENRLAPYRAAPRGDAAAPIPLPKNAVWVTRRDVHVDRIASAWLIRRFIDTAARFKFVPSEGYRPKPGEVRFDMFEAEFTHEGDACTFEVLLVRARLSDPALLAIGGIVHDLDLKDGKFGRPETPGIDQVLRGIALGHADDRARLDRGAAVFDDLYQYLRRQKPAHEEKRT
jgi:hypothetical protein